MDLTTQNIFTNFKDVVKVKDLQKMLGIGRNLAYELISTNQIKSIKSGNLILIPKQNVIDFLNEGDKNAKRYLAVRLVMDDVIQRMFRSFQRAPGRFPIDPEGQAGDRLRDHAHTGVYHGDLYGVPGCDRLARAAAAE